MERSDIAVVSLPARLFRRVRSLCSVSVQQDLHVVGQGIDQISSVILSIRVILGPQLRQEIFSIGPLLFLIIPLDLTFDILALVSVVSQYSVRCAKPKH